MKSAKYLLLELLSCSQQRYQHHSCRFPVVAT